jgi:hypothetical protein
MKAVDGCGKLDNVTGESGTNIGGMLEHVRQTTSTRTLRPWASSSMLPAGIARALTSPDGVLTTTAERIMKAVDGCGKLDNVTGESGTNIGGMLEHVRQTMAAHGLLQRELPGKTAGDAHRNRGVNGQQILNKNLAS